MREKTYYEIHVFYNRNDGYSAFIQTSKPIDEDELIEEAIRQGKVQNGDGNDVDYTKEISYDEYIKATT